MDQETKLIEMIQHYSFLYDKANSLFKDKSRKQQAWQSIADAINMNVDECIRLWKSLRERYTKERRGAPSGSGGAVPWVHLQRLEFLSRHILTRRRTSNFIMKTKICENESPIFPYRRDLFIQRRPSGFGEGSEMGDENIWNSQMLQNSGLDDSVLSSHESPSLIASPAPEPCPEPRAEPRPEPCPEPCPEPRTRQKADEKWKETVGQALTNLAKVVASPVAPDSDAVFGTSVGLHLKGIVDEKEKNFKKSLICRILYSGSHELNEIAEALRK